MDIEAVDPTHLPIYLHYLSNPSKILKFDTSSIGFRDSHNTVIESDFSTSYINRVNNADDMSIYILMIIYAVNLEIFS